MGVAALNLPQSPRASVFRALETIVRGNPVFGRVVKPSSFRTWKGDPMDAQPFGYEIAPAMRWTPMNGGEIFKTPDTIAGLLTINCEILIKGTNVDDTVNFWWMVVRCFYPGQAPLSGPSNNDVIGTLQAAGARSGLVMFPLPSFDQQPDGVWLAAQGQISIEVQSSLG